MTFKYTYLLLQLLFSNLLQDSLVVIRESMIIISIFCMHIPKAKFSGLCLCRATLSGHVMAHWQCMRSIGGGKVLDDNIALSYDVVFISSTRQSVGKPRHRINKCVSEIPVTATVIVSRFES